MTSSYIGKREHLEIEIGMRFSCRDEHHSPSYARLRSMRVKKLAGEHIVLNLLPLRGIVDLVSFFRRSSCSSILHLVVVEGNGVKKLVLVCTN